MGRKISWKKLKIEYATTDISYREIARKYNIPLSTVTKQAAKEKWVEERKHFGDKVTTKSVRKISDRKSDRLAELAMAADSMGAVIQNALKDDKQFYRFVDKAGNESIVKKVDSKAIREMTAAIKELTALVRDLYNIPSHKDDFEMKLAREKFELDKQKAAADEDKEGGEESGVLIVPPIIEEEDEHSMETTAEADAVHAET